MIVKCQRSLYTSEFTDQMLFYTRKRRWIGQYDLTPEWGVLFQPFGTERGHKFFARVEWPDMDKPPVFIEKVCDQGW